MNIFHKRQGQMELNDCYFYTDTINNFQHLLVDDKLKMIVISSLQYFVRKEIITLYGFVIMPSHIHLLWIVHQYNGKETVVGSFAKYTAHQFKKHLMPSNELEKHKSDKQDRNYQFWKRDPLAIPISTEKIFLSKLEYNRNNPVRTNWELCTYLEEYHWSSIRFYLEGQDEFSILTHLKG